MKAIWVDNYTGYDILDEGGELIATFNPDAIGTVWSKNGIRLGHADNLDEAFDILEEVKNESF